MLHPFLSLLASSEAEETLGTFLVSGDTSNGSEHVVNHHHDKALVLAWAKFVPLVFRKPIRVDIEVMRIICCVAVDHNRAV